MRGISEITVVIGGVIKTNYWYTGDVIFACHKVARLVAFIITRLSSNNRSVGTDYVIIVILYFAIFSLPLTNFERKSTNCDLQQFLPLRAPRSLSAKFLFRKKRTNLIGSIEKTLLSITATSSIYFEFNKVLSLRCFISIDTKTNFEYKLQLFH